MQPDRATLEQLFEGAPRFVDRLMEFNPPADTWEDFFARAEWTAVTMPEDEQVALLDTHPRIGAVPSTVSALSYREQGYDHDPGTADLQRRLDDLNDSYEGRFGFRFVVFVNGRSRAEIANELGTHLEAERAVEKVRGLRDVVAIARSRQRKIAP